MISVIAALGSGFAIAVASQRGSETAVSLQFEALATATVSATFLVLFMGIIYLQKLFLPREVVSKLQELRGWAYVRELAKHIALWG